MQPDRPASPADKCEEGFVEKIINRSSLLIWPLASDKSPSSSAAGSNPSSRRERASKDSSIVGVLLASLKSPEVDLKRAASRPGLLRIFEPGKPFLLSPQRAFSGMNLTWICSF